MALTKTHNRMIAGASANVKDFGAAGDGITDDTAAIQAAFAHICSINGHVYFPSGTYIVSSGLVINADGVTISGDGNGTTIKRNFAAGDLLLIAKDDPTSDTIFNITMNSIRFDSSVACTSGAMISVKEAAYHNYNNISIQNGFIGFYGGGLRACFIDNIHIRSGQLYGANTSGSRYMLLDKGPGLNAFSENTETYISNFNCTDNGTNSYIETGIEVKEADGYWFDTGHIRGAYVQNVLLNGASTTQLLGLKFSNVWFDGDSPRSLSISGSTANFAGSYDFTGCTFTGGTTHGLDIASGSTLKNAQFTGCRFGFIDTQIGLNIAAGESISFTGCSFHTFNTSGAASASLMLIGSGVDNVNINGGSVSRSPNIDFGFNSQQGAGQTLNVNGVAFRDVQSSGQLIQLNNPDDIIFTSSGCSTDQVTGYVAGNEQHGQFLSVATDTAVSTTIGEILGGVMSVSLQFNQTAAGLVTMETSGAASMNILVGQANLAVTTGVLTGTTGASGKLTVSITDDGVLYFENRTGVTRNIQWKMLLRDLLV